MNPNNDLRGNLTKWAEVATANTKTSLMRGFLRAALETHKVIDRLSQGMLVFAGAAVSLIVSDLTQAIDLIGADRIRNILSLFMISSFFGFTAMVMSVRISSALKIDSSVKRSVTQALRQHTKEEAEIRALAQNRVSAPNTSIDFDDLVQELSTVVPFWQKKKFTRMIRESKSDPNIVLKMRGKELNWYRVCVVAQCFIGLAPIAILAYAI